MGEVLIEAISAGLSSQLQTNFTAGKSYSQTHDYDESPIFFQNFNRQRRNQFTPAKYNQNRFNNMRQRQVMSTSRNFYRPSNNLSQLSRFENKPMYGQNRRIVFAPRKPMTRNQNSGPTKIVISNLEFNVNDDDIKELYFQFGHVKRYGVHYTEDGKSLGTAEVHYDDRKSAEKAYQRYNNVTLDGRAMKIAIIERNIPVHMRLSGPFYLNFPRRQIYQFNRKRLGQHLARKFVDRSKQNFFWNRRQRNYHKNFFYNQKTVKPRNYFFNQNRVASKRQYEENVENVADEFNGPVNKRVKKFVSKNFVSGMNLNFDVDVGNEN